MLPIREMSEAGTAEKSIHSGRINNLHRWWASRPTTISRITAYASLMWPPLSDHEDMIRDMYDYSKSTNYTKPSIRDRVRRRIRKVWGDYTPKVLDPFGGSGALPYAAAWLGAESHSMDYNPVAVFIQKCALEYPAEYGKRLLKNVEDTTQTIQREIKESVGEFYPDETMDDGLTYECYGYRWCRTIQCACGVTIPLVKSYMLSKKRGICLYPRIEGKRVRVWSCGRSVRPNSRRLQPQERLHWWQRYQVSSMRPHAHQLGDARHVQQEKGRRADVGRRIHTPQEAGAVLCRG